MKYITQLTDDELLKLLKPFVWGDIKEVKWINRYDGYIEIVVLSETEDDDPEYEGEILLLEDQFDLSDYDVKIWDYQANNKNEMIRNYRKELLNRFGNQYALDYLLG